MRQKRVQYIDYTKGVGILFIVLAHCIQYFKPMQGINGYLCSFHVPVFFIVAGCLGYHKWDSRCLIKKFFVQRGKSLLIPYIIFSFINALIKLGVLSVKNSLTKEEFFKEMQALFITGNGTVWFLMTLFIVELFFQAVKNVKESKRKYMCIGIIMLLGLVIPYYINSLRCSPWGIVLLRIIAGIGYYGIGFFVGDYLEVELENNKMALGIIMFVIGGITYICGGSNIDFFNGSFSNILSSLISSICTGAGIVLLLYVVERKKIESFFTKWMLFLGQNSLIIMLVHPTILLFFTYPLGKYFATCYGVKGIIFSMLLFVIIVILNILVIFIYKTLKKYK